MSQISADQGASPWASRHPGMRTENITLSSGSGSMASVVLMLAGVVGIAAAFAGGKIVPGATLRHSLSAVHIGAMTVLAASLGGIFFCMVFHLVNAGWASTIRRQFENLASLVWLPIVLVAGVLGIEFATGGQLFRWFSLDPTKEVLLGKKAGYLNEPFFAIRSVAYVVIWFGLARMVVGLSRRYDETGEKRFPMMARKYSAPGMVLFALSTAFAAFDWLKSMDYSFFSTMWGVWYFSGCAFTATTTVYMIIAVLKSKGKLEGVVTQEHLHDLGKLIFAFTCFWAYITFFQYFLIWYANIPEETAWFVARKQDGWEKVFLLLCFGHFVVPFVFVIFRPVKKNVRVMFVFGLWLLLMQVVDLLYVVRPVVYAGDSGVGAPGVATSWWIDSAGIGGVLCLYAGLLIRQVASAPLVPLNDPRMGEALRHKNYV